MWASFCIYLQPSPLRCDDNRYWNYISFFFIFSAAFHLHDAVVAITPVSLERVRPTMKQNYQARCFLNWQPGSGGLYFLTLLYEAQMAPEQKAQERKHNSKHSLGCGPAPLLHLTPRPCLRLPFHVLWLPTHLSWAAALSWGDTDVQIEVLPGSGVSQP